MKRLRIPFSPLVVEAWKSCNFILKEDNFVGTLHLAPFTHIWSLACDSQLLQPEHTTLS